MCRLGRNGGVLIALVLLMFSWGTVQAQSPNADLAFDMEDIDFILEQIKFSEEHARRALLPPVNFAEPRAACDELLDILPNASVQWGLRTVDGSCNNLIPGQTQFGQADLEFPTGLERVYRDAQPLTVPLAPNDLVGAQTSYNQGDGRTVQDPTPRLTSQLIVNQSVANPAAVFAAGQNADSSNVGPDITGIDQFEIPNVAPDEGLSAPTNAFISFFGQFFDHGLDLVNKGGNGLVFMPLQPDDPLFDPTPGAPNFMLLTRATLDAGPDGIIGTADDVTNPINATTPHVDQQQTYASHASAQVLLRHYEVRDDGLQASGRLLNGFGDDQILDNADDGGLATWDSVQAQAREKLGFILDDFDGANMPMFAADPYGNFIPGPVLGLPQLVTSTGTVEGNLTTPVDASLALRINHSFFLDVAHTANPNGQTGPLLPDPDTVINPRTDSISGQTVRGIRAAGPAGTYDDELLGVHFSCGDGRCNENIALTTIHHIFHREHNRLTNVAKRVILDVGDLARLNEWLDTPLAALPTWTGLPFPVSDASLANQAATQAGIDALNLDWNGERIFQAARFGTEMQYNRIVFDEFGPALAGLKDAFSGFHTDVDPTITTEFSQSVYRFGHSMLTDTVDRFDPNFNTILDTPSGDASQLHLFEAFLNPLAFYDYDDATGTSRLNPEAAAGAVVRGITRTRSNEIDEFVIGVLQNNLLGLPLDLGAINIARGRDTGVPPLNAARRMFFAQTLDSRLMPYAHWADYTDNLRHEPSLVNFIAAYGTHPTLAGADGTVGNADDPNSTFAARRAAACAIVGARTPDPVAYCEGQGFGTPPATPADAMDFLLSRGAWASDGNGRTRTGLDDVDFWNGGLAEERMPFGGYLGSTHNFVFEAQLESLQNGDRFYYVGRTANIHLFSELESNSFTALVMRNTDLGEAGAGSLPLNIFSVPNHILEVDQSQQFDIANLVDPTADPTGDAELVPLVIRGADLLTTNIFVSDTTRVVQYTGGDHVTIGGTSGNDTMIGGIGDDAIIGGAGNDRIEGGDGADLLEGGAGDDIITDLSGPDVIEGGAGNDAISSGNEEDVIFGDAGNDFIINPSEFGLIFGGLGDDYILDGIHLGHTRGGAGDDWMENLGGGEDLFQGDNGAAPELGEPPIKGNDVFIAYGGNNDADMENGDDIIVDGPGIERAEGQLGFDWMSFQNDRFGVNIDLDLSIFLRPQLPPSNHTILNRYDRIEGISGSPLADILRGTPNPGGTDSGNELVNFALIEGLNAVVPLDQRRDLDPDPLTGEAQFGWTGGEIILGGAGSDLLIGEGGDDIIDGDAALKVAIRTPNPAIRMGPLGQALLAAKAEGNSTVSRSVLDADAAAAFTESKATAEAAVAAANAAVDAANAAVAAEEAAQAGLSNLTITDAIGNLIQAVSLNGPAPIAQGIRFAWQDFLNSCSAALNDLGFDVGATTASTAAETLAAQAAAVAANVALTQANLDADAVTSAALVAPTQADFAAAQAAMDAADEFILVASMQDVMEAVFGGFINPGELAISRVIGDDDPADVDTDIVVYSGPRAAYTIVNRPDGFIEITDNRILAPNLRPDRPGNEGRDLVRNVERLQFGDQTLVLDTVAPINSVAMGQPTISGTATVGMTLTASIAGVTDADNVIAGGAVTSIVDWLWQVELDPASNFFTPIERADANGDPFEVHGENIALTAAEEGLRARVVGVFQDEELVFETVISELVLVVGVPPGTTTVDSFTATPATISSGGSSTLAWTTSNATSVTIVPTAGPATLLVDGSAVVSPAVTTTYTLTATGLGGTATATATVIVTPLVVPTVTIDRAEFRTGRNQWTIRGTSSVPGFITEVVLDRTGEIVANNVPVDAIGDWAVRVRGSAIIAETGDTITATATSGASATALVPVR